MNEAKEPLVDASSLLKELVDEISSAKNNLENGLVRKFEESNERWVKFYSQRTRFSIENYLINQLVSYFFFV